MIDQSNRAGKQYEYDVSKNLRAHYFICIDIGGMPGTGAAYNPDGSMRYMMDGGQQFTPPGKSYATLLNLS